MNKFEQLIEYVINDEDQKAADLFHEIVVEKSRDIYESLITDEINEEEDSEEIDEIEDDVDSDEINEAEEDEFAIDGDEELGSDEGLDLEAPEGDLELNVDAEAEDLEDRVVDVEDKLDELITQFDALVGDEELGSEEELELGGEEELELGGEEELEFGNEEEEEFDESTGFFEGADLSPAPKPVTSEEGNVNKKTVNADNAGGKGQTGGAKPVNMGNHSDEKGRGKVSVKPGNGTTEPNTSESVPTPKIKGEEAGTNSKSVAKQNSK